MNIKKVPIFHIGIVGTFLVSYPVLYLFSRDLVNIDFYIKIYPPYMQYTAKKATAS